MDEQTLKLDRGDFVIFFTDGITEARKEDGEFFELERFMRVVEDARCGSAQEMVDTIVRAVEEYTGDIPQADDMTLVVARRM